MKLQWMILLVLVYFVGTGLLASKITGGGMLTILLWFLFLSFWNKFIVRKLPPVQLGQKSKVK